MKIYEHQIRDLRPRFSWNTYTTPRCVELFQNFRILRLFDSNCGLNTRFTILKKTANKGDLNMFFFWGKFEVTDDETDIHLAARHT